MKYIIPGSNIKLFGKAIHSLAKIGDEIYIEPGGGNELALRAVNSSRSAYATFNFSSSFFSSASVDGDAGGEGRCKVMVRSLLLAFRSLAVLEKTVEWCSLATPHPDRLEVVLHCRHQVEKHYSMMQVECEDSLRAVYNLSTCSNSWTIMARTLQEANVFFLATQEEVSMTVSPSLLRMRNYSEDYDASKTVNTELSMQPAEFEKYCITEDTVLTFCLKEFRSLVSFAEYLNLPLVANFSKGGHPLILSVTTPGTSLPVSCVFVLATLSADESGVHTETIPVSRQPSTPLSRERQLSNVSQAELSINNLTRDSDLLPGRANSTQLLSVSKLPPAPSLPPSPNVSSILPRDNTAPLCPQDSLATMCPPPPPAPDTLQATPPPKKKRHKLFNRCFEKTFNPNQIPGADKVLAPDSDED